MTTRLCATVACGGWVEAQCHFLLTCKRLTERMTLPGCIDGFARNLDLVPAGQAFDDDAIDACNDQQLACAVETDAAAPCSRRIHGEARVDEPCASSADCGDAINTFCPGPGMTCTLRGDVGETCSRDAGCRQGLSCEEGRCRAAPAIGDACESGRSTPASAGRGREGCGTEASCDGDVVVDGVLDGTCMPVFPEVGDPCTASCGFATETGLFCDDGFCALVQVIADGEACDLSPTDRDRGRSCEQSGTCVVEDGADVGVCRRSARTLVDSGGACVDDDVTCVDSFCDDGVCRGVTDDGTPCLPDGSCDIGHRCVDGVCVDPCGG